MNAPMSHQDLNLPAQSVESEQSLLGALLCSGETAWDRVADVITEADFYRDDHRRIFGHIRRLSETGNPVDVITVSDAIERSNEVDQTGGLPYLAELANASASSANIVAHASLVVEKSRLRQLMAVGGEVLELAHRAGSMSAQDRIDEATGRLMALAEHGATKSEPRHVSEIMARVVDAIEKRMDKGGEISGLPTGLSDVDRKLDGMKGGDLIIIAGRPSMGKTAIAINIAENVALAGKPVLVFSLEMGDTQLITRCLSSVGGINSKAIASGKMTDEDWNRMTSAMGRLHQSQLMIDETPSLSVGQMRARARRQKRKTGLSLVVIDYLQLMSGKGNNRNEELGDITRNLKLMARDLDCPVIALSQLSRKCEERTDKRPMLSDLRESGAIEQDADVVMMMYRDDYYDHDSPFKGLAEVLIRKNRMGECGDVRLVFQGEYSRFRDADPASIAAAMQVADESRRKPKSSRRGFLDD